MRICIAFALAILPAFAVAQDMQPGKYRTTLTTDLPAMKGRTVSDEDCVTPKDIADGLSKVGIEKDSDCKVSGLQRSPGRVSYRLSCTEDGQKSSGEVTGTMTADSFDFRFMMASAHTGGKPLATRVQGKRIGACQ
jgi:hypothetical protein